MATRVLLAAAAIVIAIPLSGCGLAMQAQQRTETRALEQQCVAGNQNACQLAIAREQAATQAQTAAAPQRIVVCSPAPAYGFWAGMARGLNGC